MRRVNVADLKSGTLTRKSAGPEGRQATLVSDLGKRIRLVHELRQLRRTEKFTNRSRYRLGVYEIAGHRRKHILLDRHLFLDRTLHTLEADAELIFKQFADGTNAAVTEVIDVILAVMFAVLLHSEKVIYDLDEVTGLEQRIGDTITLRAAHLDVELQSADAREVEPASVEEHAFEQTVSGRDRRRIAGTHLAVNFEQGVDRFADRILAERGRDNFADNVAFREEDLEAGNALFDDLLQGRSRDLGI